MVRKLVRRIKKLNFKKETKRSRQRQDVTRDSHYLVPSVTGNSFKGGIGAVGAVGGQYGPQSF